MTDPHVTGAFSGTVNKAPNSKGLLRFGVLTPNVNIDALIRAEQENVSAKLLANPRIMVLDNEEARIKIIEEIPYQQLTQTSGGGSIGTTQFKEVGVELTVTPHLTRDDMIRLHLVPTFSVRLSDVVVVGATGTTPQPVIATREADTWVLIKSGETIVIGGLRKQDITQQKNKIPLLGDIPIIGNLFKFEGESTVNSELVVFITPHVVEQPILTSVEAQHLKDTEFPTPKSPSTRLGKSKDK
jgi:general secretion pathway protein D